MRSVSFPLFMKIWPIWLPQILNRMEPATLEERESILHCWEYINLISFLFKESNTSKGEKRALCDPKLVLWEWRNLASIPKRWKKMFFKLLVALHIWDPFSSLFFFFFLRKLNCDPCVCKGCLSVCDLCPRVCPTVLSHSPWAFLQLRTDLEWCPYNLKGYEACPSRDRAGLLRDMGQQWPQLLFLKGRHRGPQNYTLLFLAPKVMGVSW